MTFSTAGGIFVSLSLRTLQTQPPLYNLVCRVFAPATVVTWRRDSEVVEGGVTTSVKRREYRNELNVTEEGVYNCDVLAVGNVRNSRDNKTINVTSTFISCSYKSFPRTKQ